MKRIVLILLLSYAYIAKAQYLAPLDAKNSGARSVGILVTDSMQNMRFFDTATCKLSFPSKLAGRIARQSGRLYYNPTGTKFVLLDSVVASSAFDTTNIYAQLALRVKYTDTAVMLSPYALTSELTNQTDSDGSLRNLNITGTGGNGHIHLKHQSSDAAATGSSTVLFADVNGDLKWKNDGNFYTTFRDYLNTADRVYSFQNKNYTVADSADVAAKQNQLNGTGFVKATGTTISYDNTSYYPSSNPSGYISSYTETDPTFDTKFAAKSTSDLAEGTNKYYTDVKVQAVIDADTGRGVGNLATGGSLKKVSDSLAALIGGGGVVVATAAELNTGTDNAKFASPLGLEGSKYVEQDGVKNYAVTTGTATAYVLATTPSFTPTTGTIIYVRFHVANTGAATINVNGSGAVALQKDLSTALVANDIPINIEYTIRRTTTGWLIEDIGFAGINTSARLSGALSDETGTGVAVFGTTPTFTTSVLGGATFSAFNTVTTNLSLGGAATTMTIGGTPTTALTHTYSGNATATATTKTLNFGTGGASGSTTAITIGSSTSGATTTTLINGTTTLRNAIANQYSATIQTLSDAATTTWNANNGCQAIWTIGGTGRTLSITNPISGSFYTLKLIQGTGGSNTITTYPTNTKWSGGTAPTLSTAAGAVDIISFWYDGTNYNAMYSLDVK